MSLINYLSFSTQTVWKSSSAPLSARLQMQILSAGVRGCLPRGGPINVMTSEDP